MSDIEAQIAAQAAVVTALKTDKAPKAEIDAAVATLLALKKQGGGAISAPKSNAEKKAEKKAKKAAEAGGAPAAAPAKAAPQTAPVAPKVAPVAPKASPVAKAAASTKSALTLLDEMIASLVALPEADGPELQAAYQNHMKGRTSSAPAPSAPKAKVNKGRLSKEAAVVPPKTEAKVGEAAPSGEEKAPRKKKEKVKAAAPVDVPVFARLDLRVARILKAWKHPNADGLYIEEIDVGDAVPRQVCSRLDPIHFHFCQGNYSRSARALGHFGTGELHLRGKDARGQGDRCGLFLCPPSLPEPCLTPLLYLQVNLKPSKMRDVMSYGMVLAASNADHTKVRTTSSPRYICNCHLTFASDPRSSYSCHSVQVELIEWPEGAVVGERVTLEGTLPSTLRQRQQMQHQAARIHT
jgi:tRNA-binding EMAP/Myf-like protein